jgi:hypothetical protein
MDQRAEESTFGIGGDDAFKDDNVSLLDEGSVGQYMDHGSPLRRGGPQETGARPVTAGSVLDRGSPKMPGMAETGSFVSSAGEQNEGGLVHGVRTQAYFLHTHHSNHQGASGARVSSLVRQSSSRGGGCSGRALRPPVTPWPRTSSRGCPSQLKCRSSLGHTLGTHATISLARTTTSICMSICATTLIGKCVTTVSVLMYTHTHRPQRLDTNVRTHALPTPAPAPAPAGREWWTKTTHRWSRLSLCSTMSRSPWRLMEGAARQGPVFRMVRAR